MIQKEYKRVVIYSPSIARLLIKKGYRVVDIAPDSKDPDKKRTTFYFENENRLAEVANDLIRKEKKCQ